MHFLCHCGYDIHDTSDCLSYKACLIADQDEEELWEILEKGEKPHNDKIDIATEVMRLLHRNVYQCPKCGRIFIEDADDGYELKCFEPAENVNKKMLISAHGEDWRGYLYADWYDPKPDYCEYKGFITPLCNVKFDDLFFDDYDAFEQRYFEILDEMMARKILRRARLNVNREIKHSWEDK
ncbi:MAG: hypothetical protein K1W18_00945 [Oscillospiraceae bacterium]